MHVTLLKPVQQSRYQTIEAKSLLFYYVLWIWTIRLKITGSFFYELLAVQVSTGFENSCLRLKMTNDGQMDAAETGLDSEYKGTSTFTDGSIGEWPQKSLKAWRKLISLQGKPSDDIYKSPLRHFLTIGDILWSQIEKRHRRQRLRAAATTVADAHWCSDIVGVRTY